MATHRKVIEYVADTRKAIRDIRRLEEANRRMMRGLGNDVGKVTKVIGKDFQKLSRTQIFDPNKNKQFSTSMSQVSQQVKLVDGRVGTLTETVRTNAKGVKSTATSFKDLNQKTVSLGQNMARLAKRAILTIPIWLALRTVVMGTFRVMKDGLKTISDQDRAFQKAKRNLQGSTTAIEKNFKQLQETIRELSLNTGHSVETITNAFQKFATVGFDFETSLSGANNAVKLATVLFGDVEETANAFARTMRILVDETDNTRTSSEQIAEAMALTAELWKTNAFEINEFTASLEKFSPTAKTMNLTTEQTIALLSALSTAGLRGGRAGRLLRTSFVKLISQTDKLAKSLGVKVNPAIDTTFDIFMKTLDVLAETGSEAGKVAPEFEKLVKSIFGLRSSDAIKGLIALRKELNKNLAVAGDINRFNTEFETVNETINRLNSQIQNTNREFGRAFVTGLVGGDDFQDSLKSILASLKGIQSRSQIVGKGIRDAFTLGGLPKVLIGLFEGFKNTIDEIPESVQKMDEIVRNFVDTMNKAEKASEDLGKSLKSTTSLSFNELQKTSEIIRDIVLDELKAQGALESQILSTTSVLNRQFDIRESELSLLERQLETERAIREERRLQSRLGSDSIKLYRIAQESGIGLAKKIGEVLSGETDFSTFVRQGGEELEIFKKQFADIFEQQQALKFFQGKQVPGQAPSARSGIAIPISEQAIRRPSLAFDAQAQLQRARGVMKAEGIKRTAQQMPVQQTNNINNTFNVTTNNTDEAVQSWITAIKDPRAKKALSQALSGNNQSNTL